MMNESKRLQFRRRPSPVFLEHRPLYKICQILLILYIASRGMKSRLPRLHLLNWALKNSQRKDQLITGAKNGSLDVEAWGFDPVLAIAVRYGMAEGLIEEQSAGYKLSEAGAVFVKELLKDPDLFVPERRFLDEIGKNITETMVDEVARGWEA